MRKTLVILTLGALLLSGPNTILLAEESVIPDDALPVMADAEPAADEPAGPMTDETGGEISDEAADAATDVVIVEPEVLPEPTPVLTEETEPAETAPETTPEAATEPLPEITPEPEPLTEPVAETEQYSVSADPVTEPILEPETIVTPEMPLAAEEARLMPITQLPGKAEGAGTKFEIKDSAYLNVTLESSEEIWGSLESIPEMLTLRVRPIEGITATFITVSGLEPNVTYHKYTDDLHNHEVITADAEGKYAFAQDLTASRHIIIQPRPSTKFIRDNATGGDCTTIGTWNNVTKTCTLTIDLTETIQIENNNITLDGNGKTMTGANSGYGVYIVSQKTGITVKNLTIKKFSYGIYLNYQNSGITLMNNTVTQNTTYGIFISNNTANNILINNIVSDNYYGSSNNSFGIYIYDSENNSLSGNVISGSKYNFFLSGTTDARLNHNIGTTNTVDGKAIYFLKNISNQTFDTATAPSIGTFYCVNCSNLTVKDLALSKNGYGVFLYKPNGATVQNINAGNNYYGISVNYSSVGTPLIKDNTLSGNYYGIHLNYTNGADIRNNTVAGSYEYGIGLIYNNNNTVLTNNTVTNTSNYGIKLEGSSNVTMTGNQMNNNTNYHFYISTCYSDSYCEHNIDTTNLIGGKILYYFRNQSNQVYDNLSNPGAVYVVKGNNITVKNMTMNTVKANAAVFFYKTNNSRIENISSKDSGYDAGIRLYSSANNVVTGNTLDHCGNDALDLRYATGNTISNNLIKYGNRGISFWSSSNNNTVSGNTATHNNNGFYINNSSYNTFTGNIANNNSYGFDHSNATYNTWNGNSAENNYNGGFDLYNSKNNTIINNISKKNKYGVHLYSNAQNNIIYDNTFSENAGSDFTGAGVYIGMYYSTGGNNNNQIYRNNFISNASQVKFETGAGTGNVFSLPAPTGGNYWSDWTGPDANSDGFVDNPYVFTNGTDALPRACPGGSLNIDKAAPTTIAALAGDAGNGGWYRSNVTVALTATDAGSCGGAPSGIATTQYSYDKINWTNYISPFTVSTEGEKAVYYRSVDVAGNIEGAGQETVTFINDKFSLPNGSPSGWNVTRGTWVTENQELSGTGPSFYPTDAFASKGDLSWKNYTVELKFHPQNTSSWGIYLGTRYNGNPNQNAGGISRYAFILTASQQLINKCVLGTCYGQNYLTNYALSSNAWHTIKIELNGNKQKYYLDGSFYYEVTDSALQNGSIFLQAYGSPKGHAHFDDILVTSIQPVPPSTAVKIDKTAPSISAVFAGTLGANDWYVSDVAATLSATDNNAVAAVEYKINDNDWQAYSLPVALSESGEMDFYYRALDAAGNEASGTKHLKIDRQSPLTALNLDGTMGAGGWYVSDVVASLSSQDNEGGMGPDGIKYGFDNISWQIYAMPLTLSDVETTLYYYAVDLAGNEETAQSATVKIDKNPPVTIANLSGTGAENGWHISDVTVALTASDNEGGLGEQPTKYNVNDSGWQVYSVPFTVSSEGENIVRFLSVDAAGNFEEEKNITFKIDKTAPVLTGAADRPANSAGWYNAGVTVSFDCTDAISGVALSPADVALSAEGPGQSAHGTCIDNAGNSSESAVSEINIDLSAPVLTGGAASEPNADGWYNSDVAINFECADAVSGVAIYPTDAVISAEGENISADGYCQDKAGNEITAQITGINLDKTAPVISGARQPEANGNGWNNADVSASFTCEDALSGIEDCAPETIFSSEGGNQSVLGIARDKAGNSAEFTVSGINIDKTAPVITGTRQPEAGAYGWNNTEVTVSFTCGDELSGIGSCPSETVLTEDGPNQIVLGQASDKAGNTSSYVVENINIDKIAPVTADDYIYDQVWTNIPAMIGLMAADHEPSSGLGETRYCVDSDGACDPATGGLYVSSIPIIAEGISYLRYSSSDNAGNIEAAKQTELMLDFTPPSAGIEIEATTDSQCSFFFQWWIDDGQVSYDTVHGCSKISANIADNASGIKNYVLKIKNSAGETVKEAENGPVAFNFETNEVTYTVMLEVYDKAGNYSAATRNLYEDDDNDVSILGGNGGAPDMYDICPAQVPSLDINKDGCQDVTGVEPESINWCVDTYTGRADTGLNPVSSLTTLSDAVQRRDKTWYPAISVINSTAGASYALNIRDAQGVNRDEIHCSIDAASVTTSDGTILNYTKWDNARFVYREINGVLRVKEAYHSHELSDGAKINATLKYSEKTGKSELHLIYNNEDRGRACVKNADAASKQCVAACEKNKSCMLECKKTEVADKKSCVNNNHYQKKETYDGFRTLSLYDILLLTGYEN